MFESITPHVRGELADGVLTLTLDRPEKKNALTQGMYEALTAGIKRAETDAEIGAVLLRAEGGAFTAGNDLKDFMANDPQAALAATMVLLRLLGEIDTPLVAEVDGPAIGIGATLMLHCDFAFASPISSFKAPFIDLALTPEAGASLLMPIKLGDPVARRMLMLGHEIDAESAARCGLITSALDDPAWEAREVAKALADKPREALRATKRLLRESAYAGLADAINREAKTFLDRLGSAEAQKAFAKFFSRS